MYQSCGIIITLLYLRLTPSVKHPNRDVRRRLIYSHGCTCASLLNAWGAPGCSHSCTRRDFCTLQAHSVACSNNWVCNRLQLSKAVVHPMLPLGKRVRSPSASAASPEVNKKTGLEYILPELHQIPDTSGDLTVNILRLQGIAWFC